MVLALALVLVLTTRGGGHINGAGPVPGSSGHHHGTPPSQAGNPRLDPDWEGDGQAVTFAFGGDVHFPSGTNLGDRLAADPASALGPTVPALLSGVDLSMVNYESALTDGTCPDPQAKQYVFYAPPTVRHGVQGGRRHPHHRGQQPRRGLRAARPADGPRHQGPDGLHHPRHRPERRPRPSPRTRRRSTASTSRSSPPPR